MRVATYTRISTDEAHQPYSLDAQAERLAAYIASQDGWSHVRSFTDRKSGATLDRPGLRRAMQEARAGRYDLLLVYRVDRLARSARGLAQVLEELEQAGAAFRSATEPFETATAAGRMMVQMLGVFAEFERATIIDRVVAGMERKAARGGWASGGPPYGYDLRDGALVVNGQQAPLVPVIFERYARQRMGARAVAMWLNEQGHRTKQGRPWSHTSVLTVLRNRAYIGEVFFRGRHYPGQHAPLIDRALFDEAADLLTDRAADPAKRAATSPDYLLGGLVICQRCGRRFVGNAAHGNRYRYEYYTCFSRHRYGTATCDAERLPAGELDRAVCDALVNLYDGSDLFTEAIRNATGRKQQLRAQWQAELATLDADLAKAEQAIERYLLAFENGTLPEAQCGERVRALGAKIAQSRDRQAELADLLNQPDSEPPSQDDLKALGAELREAITTGTAHDRKRLLQALVHEVRVQARGHIVPVFKDPASFVTPEVRTLEDLVPPAGIEPATRGLGNHCSSPLSYEGAGSRVARPRPAIDAGPHGGRALAGHRAARGETVKSRTPPRPADAREDRHVAPDRRCRRSPRPAHEPGASRPGP